MAPHAEQVPHKPSNKEMKQMTTITEENTTWELWITTQMKWTNENRDGEGWEIITNGNGGYDYPTTHPRYGQRLHTIRVDETCPHHDYMNADFNRGVATTYFTTERKAWKKGTITMDEMIAILRYVVADGRFSITLNVYDAEGVAGGAVESLNLPKSVGKKMTHRYAIENPTYTSWKDQYTYLTTDGIQIKYKVNESTGERNETGEKRMNRFLKEF